MSRAWRPAPGAEPPAQRRSGGRRARAGAALLGWLGLAAPVGGLPIDPAPGHGLASPAQADRLPGVTLPAAAGAGPDPASWASTLPRSGEDAPGHWPAEGVASLAGETLWARDLSAFGGSDSEPSDAPGGDPVWSLQGLRDALLATPFGQEVLLLALEVLTPAIDQEGRIHVSLFGHGDYVLPTRGAPASDPHASARGVLSAEAIALRPEDAVRRVSLDEPQSLRELVGMLASEVTSVLTHPVTVLLALLGLIAYLAARYAFEERSLHQRRLRYARARLRRHRSRRRHHRPPSRGRLRPGP
jgi:hypothetical protein